MRSEEGEADLDLGGERLLVRRLLDAELGLGLAAEVVPEHVRDLEVRAAERVECEDPTAARGERSKSVALLGC